MQLNIKTNPKNPHHYIIAVAVHPANSRLAGKMYLKYRPIYFTNDDIASIQHAYMLSIDKLFKTSSSEAFSAVGCNELATSLTSMKMAAVANQCSLHHFSCEYEMDEESFDILVNSANTSNYSKDLLKKSSIRG